jgi:hypothetical protein
MGWPHRTPVSHREQTKLSPAEVSVAILLPIRLLTEHMSDDYHAVDFAKRNTQLWLPESVNFYIDINGHRYVNRHKFADFLLFAVDTGQEIHSPKIDPNLTRCLGKQRGLFVLVDRSGLLQRGRAL